MINVDQCSGVSELAEGYTFMRGRCKQFSGLQIGDREDLECFTVSDYDTLILKNGLHIHRSESFDQRSEDICRRISISAGDTIRNGCSSISTTSAYTAATTTDECLIPTGLSKERRPSRDIGTQAYSIEFQNERSTNCGLSIQRPSVSTGTDTRDRDYDELSSRRKSSDVGISATSSPLAAASYCNYSHLCRGYGGGEHSVIFRHGTCHYHQPNNPSGIIFAHCSYPSHHTTECHTNDGIPLNTITNDGHYLGNYMELPLQHDVPNRKLSYHEHRNSIIHDDHNLEQGYSTCSSESSTLAKSVTDSSTSDTIRKSKSGHVFLMDPCIEDSTEYAEEERDEESQPLIDGKLMGDTISMSRKNSSALDRRQSFMRSKSFNDPKQRSTDRFSTANLNDIDLANKEEVCPFGLAKNLEKQICVVPNRKKSSGRISFLKLITFVLIGSAILITSAAIKEAYYDR